VQGWLCWLACIHTRLDGEDPIRGMPIMPLDRWVMGKLDRGREGGVGGLHVLAYMDLLEGAGWPGNRWQLPKCVHVFVYHCVNLFCMEQFTSTHPSQDVSPLRLQYLPLCCYGDNYIWVCLLEACKCLHSFTFIHETARGDRLTDNT